MWILILAFVFGIIGATMADSRNRSSVGGFALGFLLGVVGIAIIAVLGTKKD
jgi:hypothetical protein